MLKLKSKLVSIFAVLVVAGLVFVVTGCGQTSTTNQTSTTTTPTTTVTVTATPTPTKTATPSPTTVVSTDTPDVVVANFLDAVLGTLPTSEVDYEKAKTYMEAEYATGLDNPAFIPMTLCIQDGPSDVSVNQPVITGNDATVYVEANYGGEWMGMWDFKLVKEDGEWLISEIVCSTN